MVANGPGTGVKVVTGTMTADLPVETNPPIRTARPDTSPRPSIVVPEGANAGWQGGMQGTAA